MCDVILDLDGLSKEEKLCILEVIGRDEEVNRERTARISQLKVDVHNLRMQSILRGGDDLSKICGRCHRTFGYIFNTGATCYQCKFKVCHLCRETLLTGEWLCTLCSKHVQLKSLTGEWLSDGNDNEIRITGSLAGGDLVKASIRKSLSYGPPSSKRCDVDGLDGAPNSRRHVVSRSLSRDEIERAGYPQDSDKKRLSTLFGSYMPGDKDEDDEEMLVTHVSCRRQIDSDTDSGSFSDNDIEHVAEVTGSALDEEATISRSALSVVTCAQNLSETESISEHQCDVSGSPSEVLQVPKYVYIEQNVDSLSTTDVISVNQDVEVLVAERSDSMNKQSPENQNIQIDEQVFALNTSTPVRNVSVLPDKSTIVRRTESDKSDSSMSSTRTASPTTKMRLLDLASKRALQRDSFESSSHDGNESPRIIGHEDALLNGRIKSQSTRTFGPSSRQSLTPHVKVYNDETESRGGDSGHISGTSTENTPEHRSRSPRLSHLSIPSLVTSTGELASVTCSDDEEEDDIDNLVASHKSAINLRGSHSNLLSSLAKSSKWSSDSRESLYSIYSNAGDITYGKIPVTGEILFGLDYNYRSSALEIYVKQCKSIAEVDVKRHRSDPYVKTYLLPDKTRTGKRKTKIKKHTLNPSFDEMLRYVISKSEIENRVLWVTVWSNDRFGRNDFLGEVMIPLDCYKFGDASPIWYPLQDRLEALGAATVVYKGDLILSVKYVTPDMLDDSTKKGKLKQSKGTERKGELQVLVKEALNLTAVRSNGSSDPFCKAYLLPEKHKHSKQKTSVVKRNCNPTWNHVFLFEDLSLDDLKDRSLELTLWDYDKLTSNDFLGGVRLNLGLGVLAGRSMEWMDARGEEISIWQSSIDRPNCWNDATIGLRPTMGKSEIRK